jgi:hypothetical protein
VAPRPNDVAALRPAPVRDPPAPQIAVQPAAHRKAEAQPHTSTVPEPHKAEVLFSKSQEGRQYHSGIVLRPGIPPKTEEIRHYHHDYHFFPWYGSPNHSGAAHHSPFSFYLDVCPPYIQANHCIGAAPPIEYVDVPVYVNNTVVVEEQEPTPMPLPAIEETPDGHQRTLRAAIDEIRLAFIEGNIEPLVNLIDPRSRIAVYLAGEYAYSLPGGDYLDLTRDALRNIQTIAFRMVRVTRKAPAIYTVTGTHAYRGVDKQPHTVCVSFAMEIRDGFWTITQVGSAPKQP